MSPGRYGASSARPTLRTPVLRRLGRLLGPWELVLAAAMLSSVGTVGRGGRSAATFVGFLGFVVVAVRRGASCGCWASLTEGPAGGAELGRTGMLDGRRGVAGGRRLADVGVEVGRGRLGRRAAGADVAGGHRRRAGRAGPVDAGGRPARHARGTDPCVAALLAKVTFLVGFVHIGTNAEQSG